MRHVKLAAQHAIPQGSPATAQELPAGICFHPHNQEPQRSLCAMMDSK